MAQQIYNISKWNAIAHAFFLPPISLLRGSQWRAIAHQCRRSHNLTHCCCTSMLVSAGESDYISFEPFFAYDVRALIWAFQQMIIQKWFAYRFVASNPFEHTRLRLKIGLLCLNRPSDSGKLHSFPSYRKLFCAANVFLFLSCSLTTTATKNAKTSFSLGSQRTWPTLFRINLVMRWSEIRNVM